MKLKLYACLVLLCGAIIGSYSIVSLEPTDQIASIQYPDGLSWGSDEDYAMTSLSIPYIQDEIIKAKLSRVYFCGTPVLEYLTENPRPSEEVLVAHAADIEERMMQR
jgi:hypothetical protein